MRIPIASYRLQFHSAFTFSDAQAILDYLKDLGISDVYASPIFAAKKGSIHGYDVVDQNRINSELGGADAFASLIAEVKKRNMGWIQDIVPNHMAYAGENEMLMDVLENGSASEYYSFFDIQWDHHFESIRGKVLAPFLGQFYGEALENGEIQLQYDRSGLSVNYYAMRFPLRVESYVKLFTHNLESVRQKLGRDHPDVIKLFGILYTIKNLPVDPHQRTERYEQIRFIKRMLWEAYKNPEIKEFIDSNLKLFNGEKGVPESFNLLEDLLSDQMFRLLFWKVATEEVNYRRFFNINDLICLRVNNADVFHKTHSLVLAAVKEGLFTGLRIDHVDGLYDPNLYLACLREEAPDAYIVVEKILGLRESLPVFWPVAGTTGYDFLAYVNELFCDRRHKRTFTRIYRKFTGLDDRYNDLVQQKKKLIMNEHMTGEIDRLAHLLKIISSRDRYGSDITLYGLKRALMELLSLLPVYRTYVSKEHYTDSDLALMKEITGKARKFHPAVTKEIQFIENFLLLKFKPYQSEEEKERWLDFIMRFQQLSGPLMAKGFEDTTLYIFNRLVSLNEVGGNPDQFGISIKEFHQFMKERAERRSHSMNSTATHDTKRGEDVRARINILSEIPEEWASNLAAWKRINSPLKRLVNDAEAPDNNDEYFLYQSMIGAFPFMEKDLPEFRERLKAYIIKSVREAKAHTGWLQPDIEYEEAFLAFIDGIMREEAFVSSFRPFQRKVACYAVWNSLSQVLLKITAPGVPDFYQGCEMWDLSFVDPDNRRPVDFYLRQKVLAEMQRKQKENSSALTNDLLKNVSDGRVKLLATYRALTARNLRMDLFASGDYIPLRVEGARQNCVIAGARRKEGAWAITVTPRRVTTLAAEGQAPIGKQVWSNTVVLLPEGSPLNLNDAITGRTVEQENGQLYVSQALQAFPVALLIGDAGKKK